MRAYDPAAGETAADLIPALDVRPDPYEASLGRRCRGVAHRVGRVAVARLRAGAHVDAPARDRRRAESARSGRNAPPRLRLQRNRPAMSRIVVTGGGGFVGSHLCEALFERGDEVVAVDNFCTSRQDNVDHLLDVPGFELVIADVDRRASGYRPGRRRVSPREPGQPAGVPPDAARDPRRVLDRHSARARSRSRQQRALPGRVDQRGLRRPAWCTRRSRATTATSIPSACARSTTKRSGSPRRSP